MTNLRLSEWASVAEIIAAVGVVVSLIYVGVQIISSMRQAAARSIYRRDKEPGLLHKDFVYWADGILDP